MFPERSMMTNDDQAYFIIWLLSACGSMVPAGLSMINDVPKCDSDAYRYLSHVFRRVSKAPCYCGAVSMSLGVEANIS